MEPTFFDHVALYVADRAAAADHLLANLNFRVIEQTDRFTLLGASADAGKLTLFDPPGDDAPTQQRLLSITLAGGGEARPPLQVPGGLVITFDPDSGAERHSVVGLALRSDDPVVTAARYTAEFGFEPVSAHPGVATVAVGDARIVLVRELAPQVAQPMLFHLGLMVESVQDHIDEATERGLDIVNIVDAPNTIAVFIDGPDGVCVEYIERKPEFALT